MTSTSTPTSTTDPNTGGGRGKRIALWCLQILLVAVYLMTSLSKLTLSDATVQGFAAMGVSTPLVVTIGVCELLGAIGLCIPRIAGLAATALVALMIGAVGVTIATVGAMAAIFPLVVLVLDAVVAVVRRHETVALARTVLGRS